MKNLYKYIVACVTLICSAQFISEQEVVTDQLIYDHVSGYMVAGDEAIELQQKRDLQLQNIRKKNDITLWYGAPGLISEALLGSLFDGLMEEEIVDYPMYERLNNLREVYGPRYKFSTIGLSYARQLRPWFSLGVKSSFAGIWQYKYDLFTNERLYGENVFNVAAMLDARFSWLRREKVEMYSSVALGFCAHIERVYGSLWPMGDVAFVGLKLGRSFYGFVEIGAGIGGSVRGGIGVRFNDKKK